MWCSHGHHDLVVSTGTNHCYVIKYFAKSDQMIYCSLVQCHWYLFFDQQLAHYLTWLAWLLVVISDMFTLIAPSHWPVNKLCKARYHKSYVMEIDGGRADRSCYCASNDHSDSHAKCVLAFVFYCILCVRCGHWCCHWFNVGSLICQQVWPLCELILIWTLYWQWLARVFLYTVHCLNTCVCQTV